MAYRAAVGFLVALWLAVAPLAAKPIGDYHRQRITAADGLPHDMVTALAQTPDGFLWIGTYEGLARFDGQRIEVFSPANTPALGDASIRELQVAHDGALVVTTSRGGVAVLRGGHWDNLEATRDLPLDVTSAWFDPEGRLWLGFGNGEIWRLADGRRERRWQLPTDGEVTGFLMDADQRVWVASRGGLARLVDDGTLITIGEREGFPPAAVHALITAPSGRLIVASGAGVFAGGTEGFSPLHPDLAGVASRSLSTGPNGRILIGTLARGLLQLSADGKLEAFNLGNEGLSDRVTRLLFDREGNLWVGTPTGLDRLADLPFVNIGLRQGLDDGYVRTLLEDVDGSVLIGGSGGLYRWRDDRVTRINDVAGGRLDPVLSLTAAVGGGAWVGTYTRGVWRLGVDGVVERDPRSRTLPIGAEVRSLLDLGSEGLWIATSDGVSHWRVDGQVTHYTAANGLPASYSRRLLRTRDGRLWVTTVRGLAVFDGRRFHPVPLPDTDGLENGFGLYQANDGALWVATSRGLVRLLGERMDHLTRPQGLPADTVFEVIEDARGDLWATSNAGISQLPRPALESLLGGAGQRMAVRTLGGRAGMTGTSPSGGAGVAVIRHSRTGDIWIATANGVSRFAPGNVLGEAFEPQPVVLRQILLDGEPLVPSGSVVRVPPGRRRLEVLFSSPTFRSISPLHYRYRLDQVDSGWQQAPRDLAVAAYTHLPPGEFTLEIEASVDADHWSPGRLVLTVIQEPQWWQRRLVRFGAPLAVVLLAVGGVVWRIRRLQARQRRIEALIEERTSALQESNAQLATLNQRIQEQSLVFRNQATTDALTRLPNRRAFQQIVDALLAEGRVFTLGLVDVDHFKQINDRFSHEAGDAVLVGVAELLRERLGMADEPIAGQPVAARWGGEEFALLWPGMPVEEAAIIAETLRQAIAGRDWGGMLGGGAVTVSVGLAALHPGQPVAEVFRLADQRLYTAKREGRNRVIH